MSAATATESPLTRRGIPTDPHLRIMAAQSLANTIGNGGTVTTFAIYFTHVVGLRATQVGLVMSIAAVVGLITAAPAGQFADKVDSRALLLWTSVAAGIVELGLLITRNFVGLVLVMAVLFFVNTLNQGMRGRVTAYIGLQTGQAVASKAYLRSVTNVGMGLGSALGGIALAINRPWAFLAVFAIDAFSYFVAAYCVRFLPDLPSIPQTAREEVPDAAPERSVWRDTPYIVVTILVGLFCMHFWVMEIAVPLWIVTHTNAPHWMVAVMLITNTAVVATMQMRFSRGSKTVESAARSFVLASGLVAVGYALVVFAGGPGTAVAIVLLLAAALVYVAGEMVGSGAQWGVQFGLAPMERQGEYQGFGSMAFSVAAAVTPTLSTWLCIQHGRTGWIIMIGLIVCAGVALKPASMWALRTRSQYGVVSHTG